MVKEFLPDKEKGQPLFFIIGMALFVIFSLLFMLASK